MISKIRGAIDPQSNRKATPTRTIRYDKVKDGGIKADTVSFGMNKGEIFYNETLALAKTHFSPVVVECINKIENRLPIIIETIPDVQTAASKLTPTYGKYKNTGFLEVIKNSGILKEVQVEKSGFEDGKFSVALTGILEKLGEKIELSASKDSTCIHLPDKFLSFWLRHKDKSISALCNDFFDIDKSRYVNLRFDSLDLNQFKHISLFEFARSNEEFFINNPNLRKAFWTESFPAAVTNGWNGSKNTETFDTNIIKNSRGGTLTVSRRMDTPINEASKPVWGTIFLDNENPRVQHRNRIVFNLGEKV